MRCDSRFRAAYSSSRPSRQIQSKLLIRHRRRANPRTMGVAGRGSPEHACPAILSAERACGQGRCGRRVAISRGWAAEPRKPVDTPGFFSASAAAQLAFSGIRPRIAERPPAMQHHNRGGQALSHSLTRPFKGTGNGRHGPSGIPTLTVAAVLPRGSRTSMPARISRDIVQRGGVDSLVNIGRLLSCLLVPPALFLFVPFKSTAGIRVSGGHHG